MLLLALAVGALSLTVAAVVCGGMLAHPPEGLLRDNFRGAAVPVVGGMVILGAVLAGELVLSVTVALHPGGPAAATFASADHWGLVVVVLGFFGLGLLDDVAGAGQARGLRGHLRALLAGEVTGGAVKALGGVTLGFIVGVLWDARLGPALLDAAVVALSANLLNLLDLRPGRAGKVFLVSWAALAAAAWGSAYVVLSLPAAAGALRWLGPDLAERGMLGDAGANLLGAVLGAGAVLGLGVRGRLVVLGALVVLTVVSERWSFSRAIDRVPPLRWLDHLGRSAASERENSGGA